MTQDLDLLLKKSVDDSIFALKDWQAALGEMDRWLGEKNLSAKAQDKIEYISCCAKKAEMMPVQVSLSVVLEEMLADYGFEAATKKV
jgi:hypothetical protein